MLHFDLQFTNGDQILFSISDGTSKDILGSGVSVYTKIKSSVDMLDLDMDGDIDLVMYGDQFFGRFKDDHFSPLLDEEHQKMNGKRNAKSNILSYLKKNNSKATAPNP